MSRSLKKGFYVNTRLLKKIENMKNKWEKKVIKVWDRACQIVPQFVWFTIAVYNGKQFVPVYVTEEMIWHRLWEFVQTRTFRGHPF